MAKAAQTPYGAAPTPGKSATAKSSGATVASLGVQARLVQDDPEREQALAHLLERYDRVCREWNSLIQQTVDLLRSDASPADRPVDKPLAPTPATEKIMPFVEIEDVGTTPRRKLTPHRRLKAWEGAAGVCVLCDRKIDGVRERWIVEHLRALELGGADDLSNMGPAHEACAFAKTADDHRRTARAKRQKIRHIGAEAPKRRLPLGKSSPWKRTLSGRIVRR